VDEAYGHLIADASLPQYHAALCDAVLRLDKNRGSTLHATLRCLRSLLDQGQAKGRKDVVTETLPALLAGLTTAGFVLSCDATSGHPDPAFAPSVRSMGGVLCSLLSKFQSFSLAAVDVNACLHCLCPLLAAVTHQSSSSSNSSNSSSNNSKQKSKSKNSQQVSTITTDPPNTTVTVVVVTVCDVLTACIKYRSRQTYKVVPAFLQCIRSVMRLVMGGTIALDAASAGPGGGPGASLARLLQETADQTHKKALGKYMVHVILDYLKCCDGVPLDARLKRLLLPCVYAMLALCSDFEYKQVHLYADHAGKALFKKLYADYTKTFQFTGKV
jgi:hypothetical protein